MREFLASEKYEDLELVKYVGLDETTKRYYPSDSLASVVLGFVGSDDQGLAGLESYYDNELTGIAGRVVAAKSATNFFMFFISSSIKSRFTKDSLRFHW